MATIDIIARTTGVQASVLIDDLGFLELIHPSSVNLTDIFESSELADSDDLQEALAQGLITLEDAEANLLQNVNEAQFKSGSKATFPSIGLYAYASTDDLGNIIESRGIASCTRTATGIYAYLFEDATPTPNYVVSGQAEPLPSQFTDTNIFIGSKGNNGFEIRLGVGDNGGSNDVLRDRPHTVWVLGPTASVPIDGGSVATVDSSVNEDAIVKYADSSGNAIAQSVATVDSSGINIPALANYKINGQPIELNDLANVASQFAQNGQVLEYDANNNLWFPTFRKAFWQWGGAINQQSISSTRSLEGYDGIRLERAPYVAFTDCFIYAVTLSGLNLNEPWFLDIIVNGQLLISCLRIDTATYNAYAGLFIQINAGSSVAFQFRRQGNSGSVGYPKAMCYLREL